MTIKGVVFDIDGTLYPNRSMYIQSARFFLTHFRLVKHFSHVRKELRKVGRIENFHALQAELLAIEMKISRDKAAQLIEEKLYGKWERTFRKVKPFKTIIPFLEKLKEKGIPMAILSDFPVGRKLEYFGLEGYWSVIRSSHQSGYLKPSAKPFLEMAKKMDLNPEDILYVGNNYSYDAVGSHKAGMKSALISRKRKIEKVDFTFKSYVQLWDKVEPYLCQNRNAELSVRGE